MRHKRAKRTKRTVGFYTNSYGFREPFNVLVDGTFCQAALGPKIHIKEAIPSQLGGPAQLVTTPCVINEVEQLGEDLLGAKLILRRFKTRSCGHRVPIDADQCIKSMVKGGNRHHFFLATQDPAVKRSVAEVPGVPVFTIVSNVLILEPPSRASVLEAEKRSGAKLQVSDRDQQLLHRLTAGGGSETVQPRKRRKQKGVNPLAMKKKAKRPKTSAPSSSTIKPPSQP